MRRSLLVLLIGLALAGCVQTGASPKSNSHTAEPSAPSSPYDIVLKAAIDTGASVGASGGSYGQTAGPAPFKVDVANMTGGRATAYWNSTDPLAQSFVLNVLDKPDFNGKVLAQAKGPSPLSVQLPPGLAPGTYGVEAVPADGSASVADHVDFVIVLHYG